MKQNLLSSVGRTPLGVRGLKQDPTQAGAQLNVSHPARGAWIETADMQFLESRKFVAPRSGCVD